jgi:phage/plasmid-associated DNA primase
MNKDFTLYKPRLAEYLHAKGVDTGKNPTHCFNHAAHNHGDANPSLQLFPENYKCHGCGIHGDIYDAVEILEGITNKDKQLEFLERFFGGTYTPAKIEFDKEKWQKEADTFVSDPAIEKEFEAFLKRNPKSDEMIRQFLDTRASVSTKGAVKSYPDEALASLAGRFFYWPGLREIADIFGRDKLKKIGIPLVNPNTDVSSWGRAGVVMKLGAGYKLHYYEKKYCKGSGKTCGDAESCPDFKEKGSCFQCEKRNSKGGKTFPMPGAIDTGRPVVLVEGEMNALSASALGIENIFATGGTNALTKQKVQQYLMDVPEIILCFDSDEAGRKASALEPLTESDKRRTNIPQIILQAGYKGKIRVAELPPKAETGCKDPDALILAGQLDILKQAIADAKEYEPKAPPPRKTQKTNTTLWEAYDSISIERLKDLLKKIERSVMDGEDIQPFITACRKSCKHAGTKTELLKWGASENEINSGDDASPYFILELCNKYGISKYLRREIEKSLVPESEMLKAIKEQPLKIKVDFDKLCRGDRVFQLLATQGVQSAALVILEAVAGNALYLKNENKFYLFNGHVWEYESDITGVIYAILLGVIRYCLENKIKDKNSLWDLRTKTEGRKFRVEVMQDFSGFHEIHQIDANFDSPAIKETLTLADGVMDFSGSQITYRKSKREELRRDFLPYRVADVKKIQPAKFFEFMKGNFKNAATLETLMYYLSLVPSRNTQFKYGGVFIGKRHTGKTTTVELLKKVFDSGVDKGKGMMTTIPSDILVTQGKRRNSGNEATPYIAELEGKGAGVASETEKGGLLNNALFKLLTGGDTLIARGLYQAPRSFTPTAQIIICTNHSPRFDAQDSATVDRMVIIPFMIEHTKTDKSTKSQSEIINGLRSEYPGIVRVLAEHYLRLRVEFDGAIPFSDECMNYKNNYVDEQRTDLDKFFNDNIETGLPTSSFEKAEDLYKRFLEYYNVSEEDAEREALPRKKFTYLLRRDYLEMKHYKQKRLDGKPVACFFGIKLKALVNEEERPIAAGYYDKQSSAYMPREARETASRKTNGQEEDENPFE